MENKANSKVSLEKFHSNMTGKDSFYVGVVCDNDYAIRSEWFDDEEKANEYYQKAIDVKCIGNVRTLIKESII